MRKLWRNLYDGWSRHGARGVQNDPPPWKYIKTNVRNFKWFWCRHPASIIRDLWWWIKYRTTHRNHIIKTDLTPGWWDCDSKLLYASFAILERFVEREHPFERIVWDDADTTREYANEIHDLYLWWKDRKNKDLVNENFTEETARYEEETENLIRLMKIRTVLWT